MKISVAVCTYNRAKLLERCLNSLINQNYDKTEYEIIVIDNNSSDNTKEVVYKFIETYPDCKLRYIFEPIQGLSVARNKAIKETNSEILLFIDDDALADENLLKEHIRIYDEFKNVGCVGGKIDVEFIDGKPRWLDEKYYSVYGYLNFSDYITEMNSPPIGTNISFSVNIIKNLNLKFDENLGRKGLNFNGGEETAFCKVLLDNNYKIIYNPYAKVYHIVPYFKTKKSYFRKIPKDGAKGRIYNFIYYEKLKISKIFILELWNLIISIMAYIKNIIFLRFSSLFYSELNVRRYFFSLIYLIKNIIL